MSGEGSAARAGREGRPWRGNVVVADLSRLHGPTRGVVVLPHRLFWQPGRRVNLDNPAVLAWTYETVLREAVSEQELRPLAGRANAAAAVGRAVPAT